jgi:hypothetical protein
MFGGYIHILGFGGRKAPSSMGKISIAEVLRLRATSPVSHDQSARRCAQDDESVGVLTKNTLNKLALIGHGPGYPRTCQLRSAVCLGLYCFELGIESVTAQQVWQVLGEGRTRHHHVTARFHRLRLQVTLQMREKADH